jgi:hypothetical protein
VPKNESFSSYLKDLNFSKVSDMWTIDKTHNKFLAHDLKKHFKVLNFARKLFLMRLKKTPPALENLSLSIYIYQIVHEMNGFVESVQMMIIFYETYIAAQQELGKITFDLC